MEKIILNQYFAIHQLFQIFRKYFTSNLGHYVMEYVSVMPLSCLETVEKVLIFTEQCTFLSKGSLLK